MVYFGILIVHIIRCFLIIKGDRLLKSKGRCLITKYVVVTASLVFYSTNCVTSILFLRLALRWPRLSQQIAKTESSDPNRDKTLVKKCNITCVLVLSLALGK